MSSNDILDLIASATVFNLRSDIVQFLQCMSCSMNLIQGPVQLIWFSLERSCSRSDGAKCGTEA